MSDQPVRTRVMAGDRWWPFQEFMVTAQRSGAWDQIQGVEFRGAANAHATPEVLAAIAQASVIVIGPSNPIISIGPILAVEEIRAALADRHAPAVAVSPFVGGAVLKGPTAQFMRWRGLPLSSAGLAACYEGLIDGIVADEMTDAIAVAQGDVMMDGAQGRRRLAEETLAFAARLTADGVATG
jgi:LPPG:FO 2-phospho-L-lactate transferase